MRFKLDAHLDSRLAALVAKGGHDVETLVREGLAGVDDDAVYDACRERSERSSRLTWTSRILSDFLPASPRGSSSSAPLATCCR